jgi:histidinol-phosphate aminotransferase
MKEEAMSLSRRGFVRTLRSAPGGHLSAAVIAARGHEALEAERWESGQQARMAPPRGTEIRISSNENPLGPGRVALDAIVGKFPEAGRYPFNSTPADSALVAEIAKKHGAKNENVVLGAGSGEILRNAVRAFTSASKPLVTANPSFESPFRTAEQIGTPVKYIPLDSQLRLDLGAMVAAAKGAGLVFICNPNNPTATVHSAKAIAEAVEGIRRSSPDTVILLDEAYHDYVTDPAYATGIAMALQTPNVFVSRTFSKAFGMAGLRIGYGIGPAATMKALARYKMPYNISVPGVAAAIASLNDPKHIDEERARNTEVRGFTVRAFEAMGFKGTDTQANFIFVDLRRPAREFREACRQQGVSVGRDFPPYEKTHSRISIGTAEEMRVAVDVFRKVLGAVPTAASRG